MGNQNNKRLSLDSSLRSFLPNVYFQPPSDIRMKYPCIVYHQTPRTPLHADNKVYKYLQQWEITVMTSDPDSLVPEQILDYFDYCTIRSYFVVDGLNHTILNLHY